MIKEQLQSEIQRVLSGIAEVPDDFIPELEVPNNTDHGDWSTNASLQLARHLRKSPRVIAQDIARELSSTLSSDVVESVEVAGAGFINFTLSNRFWWSALENIIDSSDNFGRTTGELAGSALVEYVSANPTGPLTVGHGRNAVLGDTIANLLEWTGHTVTREYYFNDAGRQMRILGESVRSRYLSLVDPGRGTRRVSGGAGAVEVPEDFPDEGYLGEYIADIAQSIFEAEGSSKTGEAADGYFKDAAERVIFADIESTLARLGISVDNYFNEFSLYETEAVWQIVDRFRKQNLAYDRDGAVWFKTTEFGKEKDTVLVKSSGEPTYRLPDIAYHVDKFERNYDRLVDVFGADHIATYPDVSKGVEVLGYDASKIDVVIYQFVTLVKSGKPVKMSTRKATYVTLDDLIDEVGADVVRFFFLMRSANTHLEFDLDLAKEASDKNPVFYLQYAHARICSILRKADEVGLSVDGEAKAELLSHPSELNLVKTLYRFPEVLAESGESLEPHRLTTFMREVAVAFTEFYGNCRIIGEETDLAKARLQLAVAARTVLKNGLTVLGISAPERM